MSKAIHKIEIKPLLVYKEILPYHPDLFRALGNHYMELYHYDKALSHLLKAEKLGIRTLTNLKDIAYCYRRTEQYSKALAYYLAAEQKGALDQVDFQDIAFCYRELSDYSKALEYYLKAVKLTPKSSWIWDNIGWCYQKLDKYEKALECHLKAYHIASQDAWTLRNVGFCYQKLSQYESALEYYKKSLIHEPDNTFTLRKMGWCFIVVGDFEKAQEMLVQALDIDEVENEINRYAWMNLGHTYWCTNHKKKIVDCYRRSIQLYQLDEFIDDMAHDYQYVEKYCQVSADSYQKIQEEVISWWKSQQNSPAK
ncbi:MAG TPA: hypothetical protein DCS93_03120 [Microscillaceae bacterium]|nr:hypothetical protein [Microscillaceae bacterium]